MVGDFHWMVSGHRETTALKFIVIKVAEIQNREGVDDLQKTVQPAPSVKSRLSV